MNSAGEQEYGMFFDDYLWEKFAEENPHAYGRIRREIILRFVRRTRLQNRNMRNIKNILRGCPKLLNGDVTEFVDRIHYGDELIFMYNGQKFFLQGFLEDDGICTTYLDRWEPPADDYIWVGRGDSKNFPVEEFLKAEIWDGKSFWEVEKKMEWLDG